VCKQQWHNSCWGSCGGLEEFARTAAEIDAASSSLLVCSLVEGLL
jgi:hypothetical protein